MTDIQELHVERIKNALARLKLEGELHDDGKVIRVTLANGIAFDVSHMFMRLVDTRQLDKRIAYGAGLVQEERRR